MQLFGEQNDEEAIGILALLILGAGLLALFTGWAPFPFWFIFAFGYGVVLPIAAILLDVNENETDRLGNVDDPAKHGEREPNETQAEKADRTASSASSFGSDSYSGTDSTSTSTSTRDALSTLRERYARGDLTDEQFEQKLDRLLETETPENAAEWRNRIRNAEVE